MPPTAKPSFREPAPRMARWLRHWLAGGEDAAPQDMHQWRERVLSTLLLTVLVLGTVTALPSALYAMLQGQASVAVIDAVALGWVALMWRWRGLPLRVRAWSLLGVLYVLGVWLLVSVGPVSQIYLMAFPVMAAVLLGLRPALVALGLTALTLMGVGYLVGAHFPTPGLESMPLMKWAVVTINFLFLCALMTLSCAVLLRGLENTLERHRDANDSLQWEKTKLRLVNEDLRLTSAAVARINDIVLITEGQAMAEEDGPRIVFVNDAFERRTGYRRDEVLGRTPALLHGPQTSREEVERIGAALRQCQPVRAELIEHGRGGETFWLELDITPILDAAGQCSHFVWVERDITSRKQAEALIWQQANFDSLTGLPNRQMLRDRLAQDIRKSHRDGLPVALMFIDLDHFKEVNDTLGHGHGDQLLVEAAHRIRLCLRASDTVARLGGDEFTVVLPGLTSTDHVGQIAQDIITALAAAFQLGTERAYVSASIGITLYPDDGREIDELMRHADQALYAAKDAGRNRFSYFTSALQEAAQSRVSLANDLRGALAAGQFRLFYQPIVELATGQIRKAEALLRWQHPARGWVGPGQFIPIAESSGLIDEIGEWVFREAAAQVRRWRVLHHPAFQISVNKSPVQFRDDADTTGDWLAHLRGLELPGDSIAVEITEGVLLDSGTGAADQLRALRQGGMAISLDDFGTGYSSLSYLQKFEIDVLKIDQAFVRGLALGTKDLALCKAIIVMAHELGMRVVAEGVETAEQCTLLTGAGCDFGQGYHFAQPMPAEAFERLLLSPPASALLT